MKSGSSCSRWRGRTHRGDTVASRDALANLGHAICDQSVGNILKEHGIEPAPDRKRQPTVSARKTFLKSDWEAVGAIDFTTIEVWTKSGLVTHYLLCVVKLAT